MTPQELKRQLRRGFQGITQIHVVSKPYGVECASDSYAVRITPMIERHAVRGRLSNLWRIDRGKFEQALTQDYAQYYHTRQGSRRQLPRHLRTTLAELLTQWVGVSVQFQTGEQHAYLVQI